MPLKIIRSDITKVEADAIVNTANPKPIYASGTDQAIYEAAGAEKLLEERKKIGEIARGETCVTPAFSLPAKYIIHTVGPVWKDGKSGEFEVLKSCYDKSLMRAAKLQCESIAFPLIATGVYGFPKDQALQIAIAAIGEFLFQHEMMVYLVVFDDKAFQLSKSVMGDVESFIDAHYAKQKRSTEYSRRRREETRQELEAGRGIDAREEIEEGQDIDARREENEAGREIGARQKIGACRDIGARQELEAGRELEAHGLTDLAMDSDMVETCHKVLAQTPLHKPASLDDQFKNMGGTFQEKLFEIIGHQGYSNVEVYTRANLDRKHFSKIQCNVNYHPSKKTAMALCIALRLDLDESRDLLARAEWAFSPNRKLDLIVMNAIINHEYNINQVNAVLFQYGQECLGV